MTMTRCPVAGNFDSRTVLEIHAEGIPLGKPQKALNGGIFWIVVMAIAGWVTYYISGSEVMPFAGTGQLVG